MSVEPNPTSRRSGNPLLVPLIIVGLIAGIEAVALLVLITRRPENESKPLALAPVSSAPATSGITTPASAPQAISTESTASAEPASGKVGQLVQSRGFGLLVEKILHEPQTYKDQVRISADERYLALLLAADNNTGGNLGIYPSQFSLHDAGGYEYQPLNLKGTMPALEWRTLSNRETVRGYVDFVVPKSARGLMLIYPDPAGKGSPTIQLELGE